jgi:anti-sigma regulatory factor (Ser/Thr protein kinase)
MSRPNVKENVKQAVEALLAMQESVTSGAVAARVGMSRQAAHAHLTALTAEGLLVREGAGRATRYRRAQSPELRLSLQLPGLQEDQVWKELERRAPWLSQLPERATAILHFAFTEVLNNAIDHSGAAEVEVLLERDPQRVAFEVVDAGEGIFEHARRLLGLRDHFEALQELSKGKVTTAPEAHTGQGLFFTSKAVDVLLVESGALRWWTDNVRGDVGLGEVHPPRTGTRVRAELAPDTARELKAVFDAYSNEDFAFSRSRAFIKLFEVGVDFVSRSEAKRLLHGMEKFEEVVLDFRGVRSVGQGFADEVFRIWARAHPGTRLVAEHMNDAVRFMVQRARGG